MKLKWLFVSRFFRMILLLLPLIISSCTKDKDLISEKSTTPTKAELKNSGFVNFITEVQSVSVDNRAKMIDSFLKNNPNSPVIEKENLAVFFWFGKARSVFINGDIQDAWASPDSMTIIECGENNFFYRIYSLPPDTRVDYKLIIEGKEITDPRNENSTPSGYGIHSQCAMPLFKAKKIREFNPDIEHGSVDSIYFNISTGSISSRWIKIFTPAGYDTLADLPCLYINDGFKALEYCSYINILDNLIASGKISPVIVVFIDFIEGDQNYFLNKTEDYTSMLCNELVPLIDKNYGTAKSPENRIIAGVSAGGNAAIFASLKRPDIFLNAAGQSSTITSDLLTLVRTNGLNSNETKSIKLYIDVARFDLRSGSFNNYPFLYSNQLLSKDLKSAGLNHSFKVFNDGHQWANWRERIDEILIYFLQ